MAIREVDNRFDWCRELCYAVTNFSPDECCNKVRAALAQKKGAESGFLADVPNRSNSKFSFCKYYYPIYSADITATYSWDVKENDVHTDYTVTTTTHNTEKKSFTWQAPTGAPYDLKVDNFVGRSDQRFYILSHVADLDGRIYPSATIYNSYSMKSEVEKGANKNKSTMRSEVYINGWSCEVFFVPLCVLSYEYNGATYNCVVNMHNGLLSLDYPVSKENEKKITAAYLASLGIKLLTTVFMVLAAFSVPDKSGFLAFMGVILRIGMLIGLVVSHFFIGGRAYFRECFGDDGKIGIMSYLVQIIIFAVVFVTFLFTL